MTLIRLITAATLATACTLGLAQGGATPAKKELAQKVIQLQTPAFEAIARQLAEQSIAPMAQVRQRSQRQSFWCWWLVGDRALLDPVGVHDVDEGPRFGTHRDDRSEVVKEAGRHFLTRKALA